ncbi:hypothetical protein Patl1_37002 [Pistacia atlantica]|nr:hypothetical protein Patl1_37002 [Pistacia atlantica]
MSSDSSLSNKFNAWHASQSPSLDRLGVREMRVVKSRGKALMLTPSWRTRRKRLIPLSTMARQILMGSSSTPARADLKEVIRAEREIAELKGCLTTSRAKCTREHHELLWEVNMREQKIVEFTRKRAMSHLKVTWLQDVNNVLQHKKEELEWQIAYLRRVETRTSPQFNID